MSEKKFRESFSLKTDDIAGAKPMLRSYGFTNKVSYVNSCVGIEKSSPVSSKLTTSRITNPLTPDYKLPSSHPHPLTPPKFIRDTMDTRDITNKKPRIALNRDMRNSLDVSDITQKPSQSQSFMLSKAQSSKVLRNPLNPEYHIKSKDNLLITIGEIEGNKPKTLVNVKTPPHDRSLNVKDIQGSALKNSITSVTFNTPKLKLKDFVNFAKNSSKITSFSGASSPNTGKSIDSGFNSSIKSSPQSISSKLEVKPSQNRVTKKPLPRSPKAK